MLPILILRAQGILSGGAQVLDSLIVEALQWSPPEGTIDLGPGYPGPELWPARLLVEGAELLSDSPAAAILYGAERGPAALRRLVVDRAIAHCRFEEVLVTAGTSSALDELCRVLARSGDVVLVEDPTYDLARTIFEDNELIVQPVMTGASGIDLDDLERRLRTIRSSTARVAFAYLIPTHHNPTGGNHDLAARHALLELAARSSLLIIEDDAYASLWFATPPPPTLRALDDAGIVVRLGTFSKILGPGLRVGWLEGPRSLVEALASRGSRRSGGGSSHLAAMLVASVLAGDGYDRHVSAVRDVLRRRWAAVATTLTREAPDWRYDEPQGGYFAWLKVPADQPPQALVATAKRQGVIVRDGGEFGGAGRDHVRLALSYYSEDELRIATQRLVRACSETGIDVGTSKAG